MRPNLICTAVLTSLVCFTLGYLAGRLHVEPSEPRTIHKVIIQPGNTNSSTAVFE